MANTITNTRLTAAQKNTVQYVTINSDGSDETDLVIYDSSVVAALFKPPLADPLTSTIMKISGCIGAASTARAGLQWDATADVIAIALPINQPFSFDFRSFGGLVNPAGTGITGDITLTTSGLASGDLLHLILEVKAD